MNSAPDSRFNAHSDSLHGSPTNPAGRQTPFDVTNPLEGETLTSPGFIGEITHSDFSGLCVALKACPLNDDFVLMLTQRPDAYKICQDPTVFVEEVWEEEDPLKDLEYVTTCRCSFAFILKRAAC